MRCPVHLALPPNLARHFREDLARRFPDVDTGTPDIHQEMYDFALRCGPTPPSGLVVSAYPQLTRNVLDDSRPFAPHRADLPPLRPELVRLGLTPPAPQLVLVAVVPCILGVSDERAGWLDDWSGLLRPEYPGPLATPPRDTPLPYVAELLLDSLGGADRPGPPLDTLSTPLDINRRVATGELAAGLLIPAFARSFRGEGARMVWPRSGALAVPLVACIGSDAPPVAHELLAHLLSRGAQEHLSLNGGVVPVREDTPGFPELEESGWRLLWPGWDVALAAADAMDQRLGAAPTKTPEHQAVR